MSDRTPIEWADASWNPLRAVHRETGKAGWACVRVSDGCKHCYAATLNKRLGTGLDYTVPALNKVETLIDEKALSQPLRWQRPRRIFICSMTDLFGEWVTDEQIDQVFAVMAATPKHTFLVLTKRPGRMSDYLSIRYPSPLPNVHVGVSVEDYITARARIPMLLRTPAAVRFVSYEPALGAVSFEQWLSWPPGGSVKAPTLDWVIVGGESGPGARPFEIEWAHSVIARCRAAGVPVFVKQLGAKPWLASMPLKLRDPKGGDWDEWADLRVREFPKGAGR